MVLFKGFFIKPGPSRKIIKNMATIAFSPKKFLYFYYHENFFTVMKTRNSIFPSKISLFLVIAIVSILFVSCSRGITPFEAANGKAKCGSYLK
jgi:hypothetical protein